MTGLLVPLGIGRGDVVAAVGAGGKTTLVYALAAEAHRAGWRVLVTTTTHMGTLPEVTTGPLFVESDGVSDATIDGALRDHGRATILGRRVRPDKLEGLPAGRVDALATRADLVLVEADGARGRSLKAPAPHEPVVPSSASVMVVLAALDVLGSPAAGERVHRPEIVARFTGLNADDAVTEEALAACLAHPDGYPAAIRGGLRSLVFLNKVEDPAHEAAAERIAARLSPPYAGVVAGSARGNARRL
ncbi:MAG TPA: selenium cofactor biosynthesis protein YqeC, partial [Vicinamibacteria bacterium]|nr:selenium cofactor biosynthesis protein YqeC [Vicinamibacteria bacterium]